MWNRMGNGSLKRGVCGIEKFRNYDKFALTMQTFEGQQIVGVYSDEDSAKRAYRKVQMLNLVGDYK